MVIVLGKFAWGPVLGLLQQREEFIHRSLADAKHDREQAEAQLKDYTAKLQAARLEAAAIVDEARRDSERLREELRQRAKTQADTIIQNAERQIQLETARAVQQIRNEAVDLSVQIASKIIQRNLSKEDNERLIEDTLNQVEGRRTNSEKTARSQASIEYFSQRSLLLAVSSLSLQLLQLRLRRGVERIRRRHLPQQRARLVAGGARRIAPSPAEI